MGVVLTGSEPRFPPASIPTLVPQAESTAPSPASISFLNEAPDTVFESDMLRANGLDGKSSQISSGFTYQEHRPPHTTAEAISEPPPSSMLSSSAQSVQRTNPSQPFDPAVFSTTLTIVEDSLFLPPTNQAGRNEVTDMLEVGRFATIVYPKRLWKGFTRCGGNNNQNNGKI